jgi:hypothetical protein
MAYAKKMATKVGKYKKGGSVKRSTRVAQRAAKNARKGAKAVDEGKEKKAGRLLKKAAKQETRAIKIEDREAKRSRKRIGRAATKGKGGMGAILPKKQKGGAAKGFKVHKMYKGSKVVTAKTMQEHLDLKKKGFSHTKPKKKK